MELNWLDEKIDNINEGNWLYRLICLFLFRKKMTYKQMFLILYGLNKGKFGEKKAKQLALARIIDIYKEKHGELPNGVDI